MNGRNLAGELALLATEVDSLAKALVLAQAELAREREGRGRAEAEADELRQQLRHARRRAQTAEREFGRLAATIEAAAHTAEVHARELEERLQQALQANEGLREEVERKERERHAVEVNLREVMENLRNAAQEARGTGTAVEPPVAKKRPRFRHDR
jgi:chromosome segregation ATPase